MAFKIWDKKWIIKTAAFNFIYICLFGIQPACNQEVLEATPASELKRLRDDLLSHYDKIQRPVKDLKKETRVLVYFDARRLVELDEKSQTLTINGQLMMKWTDEHLQWDPASYSGISVVRLKPKRHLDSRHSFYL
ncbi:acetylcholine receptor subunit alpha-type acr-16 [Caerostris extrusa]|uniref:Acetylcholine receptor subunit alpha-type acr-16 n=1 Tax=Caerostris extrusa TaxID=172846 RepID=A0AAV4T5D3_CAEEX|nr:acetylcholine receptor subunit alpha-type acr-16 [Caerostris extrusa]